jgi:formylglycine-generating enzyme
MTSPVRWSRRVALPLSVVAAVACSASTTPDSGGAGPSAPKCPSGRGPAMALIAQEGARTFCMDSTEVTRGQYRAFVASGEKPAALRELCKVNVTFEPVSCVVKPPPCSGPECDTLPQVCIDYCDAEAFCTWSGKTLCGTDDGRELSTAELDDHWKNVWLRACHGLTSPTDTGTLYPYGNTYSPDTCNTADRADTGCATSPATCRLTAAGSLPNCHSRGAYSGVFDLMGNVWEFVYYVEDPSGPSPSVFYGGAPYNVSFAGRVLGCDLGMSPFGAISKQEGTGSISVGFRCCAVPK